jgi:hypothetical protein
LKAQEKFYIEIGQSLREAENSQMFGKPCFKINGKAFISLFEDTMVFKLTGDAHREALSLDGSVQFDPSKKGRLMKEWVQVPFDYQDMWKTFATEAYTYVKSLTT